MFDALSFGNLRLAIGYRGHGGFVTTKPNWPDVLGLRCSRCHGSRTNAAFCYGTARSSPIHAWSFWRFVHPSGFYGGAPNVKGLEVRVRVCLCDNGVM